MEKMVKSLQPFGGFYEGKKVLVTGHTGFKGSWLTLWLTLLGADVTGFSKYIPSQPNHFEVLGLKDDIRHIEGDVCDLAALKKVFEEVSPDVVFHLAAQPLVMEAYDNPKLTFDTNCGGSVNVLECVRVAKSVQSVVMITSDKCYENVGWDWGYRETDRLGGADPYSASKACAEIAISSYYRSFLAGQNVRLASARAGNVIGGGDWAENRIVPDCVRAWSGGQAPEIRKPQATRPWLFVLEPLSGYLWLAATLAQNEKVSGEAFNFAPNSDVASSVKDLVEEFLVHWGKGSWSDVSSDEHLEEATLLKLSYDKALRRLNWKPVLTFQETVAMTASWYKEFYAKENEIKNVSVEQINAYTNQAQNLGVAWARG